jgi:hypothetical protein
MKTLLFTTGLIAATLAAAPVLAGPTENITGCETAAVDGSNYTTTVVPGCLKVPEGSGFDGVLLAALIEAITPDEEEEEDAE